MHSKLIPFLLMITCQAIFGQNENQDYNTKLIPVHDSIYLLQGQGGNIGLSFGADGIFMIDDQFARGYPKILETIRTISDRPVKFLVNTHFHGDHTGGNMEIAKIGAIIFSQENVRMRLEEMINDPESKIKASSLPIVTFSEDLTFYFNGEKIFVFHVHNAHTDGDAMIYFIQSNVLHTGDVFFNGKYPFIDIKNGGSVIGCIEALKKAMLVINEDTKIIPGHGDVGTFDDLNYTITMLEDIYEKVKSVKSQSEDEVAKMKNLTSKYDTKGYGDGFINTETFLRTVYKDVMAEKSKYDSKN